MEHEPTTPDDLNSLDDLEVTSLDTPDDTAHAPRPTLLGRLPRLPRLARLTRPARLALTGLLAAVVAVGLFLHATSDPTAAMYALLGASTPTPTPVIAPGANLIFVSDGVPWGILTIDGRRIPAADGTVAPIALTRGRHTLVYQARYFPSFRCIISSPGMSTDTCPGDTSNGAEQFLADKARARVIDLGDTSARLNATQRARILALANQTLTAQTGTATIQPGDHYLDASGHVVIATTLLRFTLSMSLADKPPNGFAAPCFQVCTPTGFPFGHDFPPPTSGDAWPVMFTVGPAWAITDASGHPLTGPAYLRSIPNDAYSAWASVSLTSGDWSVTGLNTTVTQMIVQNAASSMVGQAVSDSPLSDSHNAAKTPWSIDAHIPEPNPLNGYVMAVTIGGAVSKPPTGRLLWRFGALLTLDAAARQMFPQLPVATPAEQAIASQIAQQP